MRLLATMVTAICLFGAPYSALADKLPKGAEPLSSAELTKIYSGKTTNWKRSNAYFAPEGTYFHVKKDRALIGTGKWVVSNNKICVNMKWRVLGTAKTGKEKDCWTWYRSGKKYLTSWKGNSGTSEGYYDSEIKKISKNDNILKVYKDLEKK